MEINYGDQERRAINYGHGIDSKVLISCQIAPKLNDLTAPAAACTCILYIRRQAQLILSLLRVHAYLVLNRRKLRLQPPQLSFTDKLAAIYSKEVFDVDGNPNRYSETQTVTAQARTNYNPISKNVKSSTHLHWMALICNAPYLVLSSGNRFYQI